MKKAKSILVLILSITLTSLTVLEAYARQLTSTERSDYAQNNIIFYVPGAPEEEETSGSSGGSSGSSGGSSGSSSGSDGTTMVSGPEGINISGEVFKPCPSTVKTRTHTGNYYSYVYSGITYNVANTALDLDSYMAYLKSRHIAQDGKTCDPDTGKCYSGSGYNDYGKCLTIAGVMVGNLQTGNCTATDYGFGAGKGSVSQRGPTTNADQSSAGRLETLQHIYDAIINEGKAVLTKVASKTTTGTSRHFAAAVGVRAGANRASLTDTDILYLDTNGKLRNTRDLFYQAGNAGGWWIKIPDKAA